MSATSATASRRKFLVHAASSAAAFTILRNPASARTFAENEKVGVALIGVGGRGDWFVQTVPRIGERFATLCDVDERKTEQAYEWFPDVPKFTDFREMFDRQADSIDAVIIAAPDHIHGPAALAAIEAKKPVYCEKPLAHNHAEMRAMAARARAAGLPTQMGNQGTSSNGYRRAVEIIRSGQLGEIREVLAWKDGGGPGERLPPAESHDPPAELAWDPWLGPAPARPYHPEWMRWHGWREFGTGNLGNWAPHTLNLAFRALNIDRLWDTETDPALRHIEVASEVSARHGISFPKWEIVRWNVPARGELPPVSVTWSNGGGAPRSRDRAEELLGRKLDWGDAGDKKWHDHAGIVIVGSKGALHSTSHNTDFTLIGDDVPDDPGSQPRELPKSPGHEREFFRAIREGGPAPMSSFDYASPLTEFCLLGNIATQVEGSFSYDPADGSIPNHEAAAQLLRRREIRAGWLPGDAA